MQTCSISMCSKAVFARGWCSMHWQRWRTHGDPDTVVLYPASFHHDGHPQWKGDDITYSGAHKRLIRDRGRARDQRCEFCGDQAAHWALDHRDPSGPVLIGTTAGQPAPFSPNVDDYLALCVPCHSAFDRGQLQEVSAG